MPFFSKEENLEEDLVVISDKIVEVKRKIQLSEGQRKAHFEECDAEKKRNIERIRTLKKEIKEVYKKLAEPNFCEESITRADFSYGKDQGALKNKKLEEAIVSMDLKCIDLNKQLDVFKYRNKLKKTRLKNLAKEYRELLNSSNEARRRKTEIIICKPMCFLENQIHKIEMNMMEAEHINKKYKTIRSYLISDSVRFESSLRKLEENIAMQNVEIKRLQLINKEALALRDHTKGMLLRHEIYALNAGKSRECQLQTFRQKVEEKKVELNKLEKKIFSGGRVMFDENVDLTDGQSADNINQAVCQVEEAFDKLRLATGETETEDVLPRFIAQKETKKKLEFLKKIIEEEKRQLEMKKETSLAQLEAAKFSEDKERDQNQEELEKLQREMEENKKFQESQAKDLKRVENQIFEIQSRFYEIIKDVEVFNDEVSPEPSDDITNSVAILDCLIRKIQSGLSQMDLGDNLQDAMKNFKEIQAQKVPDINPVSVGNEDHLFPVLVQRNGQKQPKSGQPTILTRDSDDEEDIPSRTHLKRQAQLIVDAKSRKKFNRVLNYSKPKK